MPTHKAKCDSCDYREVFSSPLRSYEMPDETTVVIQGTFIWCASCLAVRWGEVIPVLSEIEAELASIEARTPAVLDEARFFADRHNTLEQELARREGKARARVAWRRQRNSPPRCLDCGSTDITALKQSETRSGGEKWTLAEHPGCGGAITVLQLPVLSLNRLWVRYSIEGEKLQAYQMYPSRGAVPVDENGKKC